MESVNINKNAIIDLLKLKENFDSIIESLELANDEEFMESYKKSKKQIKGKEFADWDEL